MDERETRALAQSGAVAGLCPTTEGNLGDGIFPLPGYLEAGGRIAVGGDSHITVDPAEELKALEYSQRLLHRRRNVGASTAAPHTAARLWAEAARNGAEVLGLNAGALTAGKRADFVVIDTDHVSLVGRDGAQALDSYVFVAGKSAVRDVMAAGHWVVKGGRHHHEANASRAYADAVRGILSA
jgi:formimidoylglutamate deiminase